MPALLYQLRTTAKESLGILRDEPCLLVAANDEWIWLLDKEATLAKDMRILSLPVVHSWRADEADRLFAPDQATPSAVLPPLQWVSLQQFIVPSAPVSAMPGEWPDPIRVTLVPAEMNRAAAALMTRLSLFQQYAGAAPAFRLEATRFAVNEKDDVFIKGSLLPPLPGTEYWRTGNLFLPAGWQFANDVLETVVEKKLLQQASDLLVFSADGSWQVIPDNKFVTGSRSAIRLSGMKNV